MHVKLEGVFGIDYQIGLIRFMNILCIFGLISRVFFYYNPSSDIDNI